MLMVITLNIICFLVPLGGLIFLVKKDAAYGKAFLIGVIGSVIYGIILRIPFFGDTIRFSITSETSMGYRIGTAVAVGFLIACYQEPIRYVGLRRIRGRANWLDGAAFGLGFCCLEAMGLGALYMQVYIGGSVVPGLGWLTIRQLVIFVVQMALSVQLLSKAEKHQPIWVLVNIMLNGVFLSALHLEGSVGLQMFGLQILVMILGAAALFFLQIKDVSVLKKNI